VTGVQGAGASAHLPPSAGRRFGAARLPEYRTVELEQRVAAEDECVRVAQLIGNRCGLQLGKPNDKLGCGRRGHNVLVNAADDDLGTDAGPAQRFEPSRRRRREHEFLHRPMDLEMTLFMISLVPP
jgi:hypothetical protein